MDYNDPLYYGKRILRALSRDEGSGYRAYVFEESIRRYAIDYKGWGCKGVIYLRVADVNCTQGVYKSTGFSYKGPYGRVL